MAQESSTDLLAILRVLSRHEVEFIVVGGVCAVLQGAPVNTLDLDLVHSRESGNIERLLQALEELDARYRSQLERQLLSTRFGPLNLLGVIGSSQSYPDLIARTDEFEVEPSLRVRALALEALIEVKEAAGREKDLIMLPWLRHTLEQK